MKYIDADLLRKEIEKERKYIEELFTEGDNTFYDGQDDAYNHVLALIDSLQQEQPEEICSKCIHHGKDDDYCYNPHGGIRSFINENGVYECTGFCEKEQEQPEVDLEEFTQKMNDWKARYNHPDNISIKATMAFTARMFYQYPNVARQWYDSLPKATMD